MLFKNCLGCYTEILFWWASQRDFKDDFQPYMFLVHMYQEHIYNSWEGGEHKETDFFPFKL